LTLPAPPTPADLGAAIRSLRAEHGMTQQELASAAAITKNYVSGIELGQRNPTWAVVARVATAFGLRLSELVVRAEEESDARAAAPRAS
jgi:transcriptional regulator with XRE-family HTH domain